MKYVILVVLAFLFVFHQGSAVHECYDCDTSTNITSCQDANLVTVDCRDEFPDENGARADSNAFLCESRVVNGAERKRCIQNNGINIQNCDEVHLKAKTDSCYYCDREFCNSNNSATSSVYSAIVLILSYCVMKLL